MAAKKRLSKILAELFGLLLSLVIVVPLLLVIVNSFKDTPDSFELSLSLKGASLAQMIKNYTDVFQTSGLLTGYINSAIITFGSVALLVVIAAMMAFVIQRRKDGVTTVVNYFVVAGMMLPASIIAQFFIIKDLGINNTYPGVILVYVATNIPLSVFIFTGYFNSIPRDIDEAAVTDGCSSFMLFFRIIFPLLRPAVVTVCIITGVSIWNDYGKAIYLLNTPQMYTTVTTIYSFYGQKSSEWNLLFADIVLISLPIIVVYVFLQKYIVAGMTAGSVKS
jgi:ABC-type sugar transport system, permease component